MNKKYVVLTEAEADALASLIQCIIFTNTKYYVTDAKDELDSSDCINLMRDIDNWWELYDRLKSGEYVFDDYEFIRKLSINLDFEIFNVLEDIDCGCDNPVWLYNVMSVWKKFNDYMESKKSSDKPCIDYDW